MNRFYQRFFEKEKYDYHSTQVNLKDCGKLEIQNFMNLQLKIPTVNIDNASGGLEGNPHVTCLYGINNDESYFKLAKLCKNMKLGKFTIGNIGSFRTNDDFDVLILEIESPDLYNINKTFRDNCKFTNNYPNYIPHMTLCYIKKGTCKDLEGECELSGTSMNFNKIQFCHRDGHFLPMTLGY